MKMLEKYHKEILTCTGCAFCKKACQIYFHSRKETDSPKGRIMISYGLLTGELKEDDSIVEALQKCALCKLCESVCPSMIKITDIIKAARYNLPLLPEHEKLINEIETWNEPIEGKRLFIINSKDESLAEIAKKIKATVWHGGCAAAIERIGRRNEMAGRLVERIKEAGIEEIIYYEPDCKKYFEGLNARNIIEFIESVDCDEKCAIHIPYDYDDEFKEKVKKLFEGKDVIYIHECCGGRIEFKRAFFKEAKKMAEDVIKKSNGRKLVTASMECYEHLKKYGNVIDLLHLARFKD
ncbi:MAG: (Fe-S)-binding protein [Thermoplasmata archaeon]|nr:MAG: (Fe-S)-binding protein [Thermoplasmata archaeon]